MRRFDGVIFDMDGTLVEPLLDFAAIRRELGVRPDEGILEAIAAMPPPRRTRAERRLVRIETDAARRARLEPGAAEAVAAARDAGLRTALLTRNVGQAMRTILRRFPLTFDLAWSRERGPIKPEPDGVLRACEALGILPERTACVGDFRYDVTAANAAGAVSVLVCSGPPPDWAAEANVVIPSLWQLARVLGVQTG